MGIANNLVGTKDDMLLHSNDSDNENLRYLLLVKRRVNNS